MSVMRPQLKFLDDALTDRILDEARSVLSEIGIVFDAADVRSLLLDHGAAETPGGDRILIPGQLVDRALGSLAGPVTIYGATEATSVTLGDGHVHFTPGSAAITILDRETQAQRSPTTDDYVRYCKVVAGLEHLESQSTAMVPADVPEAVSDAWRLFLSLRHGAKPIVTGSFSAAGFDLMRRMLEILRGDAESLRVQPRAMFTCCPMTPLRWADEALHTLTGAAQAGIPVELVPMPMAGFISPVTLVGSLVQHTTENLSGLVVAQLTSPGAPLVWGGSPAIFDIRYETTPMGAVETMMLSCAVHEIGARLGLPTQGYIALSDAKLLDAQAGLETGIGATLAALSGIDSVSGPGMLDFESCQSLEKLVLDHEIIRMTRRLTAGISPREDFPALALTEELLRDRHLLIADHTRRHLRDEITFPGPAIDRASHSRWLEEGSTTLGQRAAVEVDRLVADAPPPPLTDDVAEALDELMLSAIRRHGLDALPEAAR